jgi:cysteine desulfurase / selenocysteine lyase
VSRTYLNNAASSFPKPDAVVQAVADALLNIEASAGRGHQPDDVICQCRKRLSRFLGVQTANHVVLLPSATIAINCVIQGLLQPEDCVLTTPLEHNSLLRPLHHAGLNLQVRTDFIPITSDGVPDVESLEDAINDSVSLIAVSAASNVTGAISPIQDIAHVAARRGVPLLLDGAQYAGYVPLNYRTLPGRVFFVFAGHKGLLGPAGTGGLIVPDDCLRQTIVGGTGIRSELPAHPPELPLRHEAGTPNIPGFAGLSAGVQFLSQRGIKETGAHRHRLVMALREKLNTIKSVRLLPLFNNDGRTGIVSFTLEHIATEEAGYILRDAFQIHVRTGLHCAPQIHRHFGTFPDGTIRVSFGVYNTMECVNRCADAIARIVGAG